MNPLLQTIAARPYVFAFLAAFIFLSVMRWGWRRSLFWLVSGYFIAWISEYSSINNGFPYGEYHYVYENLSGELMLAGVPFFDSLSYPFMTFASYTTAEIILKNNYGQWTMDNRPVTSKKEGWSILNCQWSLVFLGAFLTMLLDVMVDPVATMGEKWFLGRIHFYAHPGWYFGVPLTNFLGWFLVALAVTAFNAAAWRIFPGLLKTKNGAHSTLFSRNAAVLYPVFYLSIALFITVVAFTIKEWTLGAVNLAIIFVLAVISCSRCFPCRRR